MDHKFKGSWRSFVFRNNEWEFQGHMDLSTMGEDGRISDGQHPIPGILLRGEAVANTILRLDTEPAGITYVGVLTHEVGNRLTISGVEHFSAGEIEGRDELAKLLGTALDQDDPPWVITKP